MGFRGQEFAFDSPRAAVARFVARLADREMAAEAVALTEAHGRILAEPVRCDRDSPPFDHAAMDGYAVKARQLRAAATAARLRGAQAVNIAVMGESRIGCTPPTLLARPSEPDQPDAMRDTIAATSDAIALRIATGAPIPKSERGADAVVKREDVIEHADGAIGHEGRITITVGAAERINAGDHIRHSGENSRAGEEAISPGEALTSASLGVLAAVGCVRPLVFARLRVTLVTTGDELVAPHEMPGPFQIRNSNAVALDAILKPHAWIEIVRSVHLRDDDDLVAVLRRALEPPCAAEAILLTGGVSMGHRDPVRAAVESLGAEILFHGLPQRPGKPMLGAILALSERAPVPIFGLPGNPVSAMVTCTRIVLPVLSACAGAKRLPAAFQPRQVHLSGDDRKRIGLWWHRPARIQACDDGVTRAELADTRGSGDIISAARSDGFVELPPTASTPTDSSSPVFVPFYPWPM